MLWLLQLCTSLAFCEALLSLTFNFIYCELLTFSLCFCYGLSAVYDFTGPFVLLLSLLTIYLFSFLLLLLLLLALLFMLLLTGILVFAYGDLPFTKCYSETDDQGDGRIDTCRWGTEVSDNNWAFFASCWSVVLFVTLLVMITLLVCTFWSLTILLLFLLMPIMWCCAFVYAIPLLLTLFLSVKFTPLTVFCFIPFMRYPLFALIVIDTGNILFVVVVFLVVVFL